MASCFYQNPILPSDDRIEEQEEDDWLFLPFNTAATSTTNPTINGNTTATPPSLPHGRNNREQLSRPYFSANRRALSFSGASSPCTNNVWHSLWSNPTWQNTKTTGPLTSTATTTATSHALSSLSDMLSSPRFGVTIASPTTAEEKNESLFSPVGDSFITTTQTFSGSHPVSTTSTGFNFNNNSPFPSPLSTSATVHASCSGTNAIAAATLGASVLHEGRQSIANSHMNYNEHNTLLEWPVEYVAPVTTSPSSSTTTTALTPAAGAHPSYSREERRHSIAVTPCPSSYFDYSASPFCTPLTHSYHRFSPNVDNSNSSGGLCGSEGVLYYNRPLTPPSYTPLTAPSLPEPTATVSMRQRQHLPQIQQQQIDDYFSPASTSSSNHTHMTNQHAQEMNGKGTRLDQLASDQTIYKVQFKCNHRSGYYYIPKDDKSITITNNDWVVVDGDRGQDFGQVVRTLTVADYNSSYTNSTSEQPSSHRSNTACSSNSSSSATSHCVAYAKRIIRVATAADTAAYSSLDALEERALIYCQGLIEEKGLKMEVVAAEFQWDRRKLTFYFSSNEQRVDFRELVHDLFKTYKTRIWMCQLNHQQQ